MDFVSLAHRTAAVPPHAAPLLGSVTRNCVLDLVDLSLESPKSKFSEVAEEGVEERGSGRARQRSGGWRCRLFFCVCCRLGGAPLSVSGLA